MKINNRKFLTTLVALGASIGFTNGAVVYFDDFTTGTDGGLGGQSLITPSSAEWSTNGWSKNTTAGTISNNNNSASVPAESFDAGDIYQLTVRVTNTSTGNGWIAMGFASTETGVYSSAGAGRHWMLWRGNNQLRALISGASFTGPDDVSPAGVDNTLDLRMIFDVDENTISYLYKNPDASDWTELTSIPPSSGNVSHMDFVGVSSNTAGTSVLSFELVNIPEPTTALLGGLGFLMLLRRRR